MRKERTATVLAAAALANNYNQGSVGERQKIYSAQQGMSEDQALDAAINNSLLEQNNEVFTLNTLLAAEGARVKQDQEKQDWHEEYGIDRDQSYEEAKLAADVQKVINLQMEEINKVTTPEHSSTNTSTETEDNRTLQQIRCDFFDTDKK